MSDRLSSVGPAPDPLDKDTDLREELARRDEEILRLRDLLIARDQELGAARGQLAMLKRHSRRVAKLAAKAPIPGAGRLLSLLARLLDGGRG